MKTIELNEIQRKAYTELISLTNRLDNDLQNQREKLSALLIGLGINVQNAKINLTDKGLEVQEG